MNLKSSLLVIIPGLSEWDRRPRPRLRGGHGVPLRPEVKGEKNSEADIATRNLSDLLPKVPGAQGVIGDTALRGVHIDRLQRDFGIIVLAPVTAAKVNPKTGERTEKEQPVSVVRFFYPGGEVEDVEVWTSGGRLCRRVFTDDGTPVLEPLRRTANPTRKNSDGSYRTYIEVEVPNPRGGRPKIHRERTNGRPEDGDFNRAENIRQIPPGDPDYARLMGRRSDAEAANRQIDDHLYLRRARSLGARRQHFDLIAHAFAENSVARHRHRMAAGPPSRAAA